MTDSKSQKNILDTKLAQLTTIKLIAARFLKILFRYNT